MVEKSQLRSHYSFHVHHTTIGRWHVFPYMTFSCNCSITRWSFIAKEFQQDRVPESENDLLQFQILRKTSSFMMRQTANTPITRSNITVLSPANSMGMSLVEIAINSPVRVKQGDIFGVFQPRRQKSGLVLQFQSGLAPGHYRKLTNSPSNTFIMRSLATKYDYPLVAVETGETVLESSCCHVMSFD